MGGVASVVSQGLRGVQVTGPLNIVAHDVINQVHYHGVESTHTGLPFILEQVPNFRAIQISILGRATPGTGLWIVDCESFCIWLNPDGWLRIMWGTGIPGAGKTIAASIVINALEAHAQNSTLPVCVCYVYFRYSDHAKTTMQSTMETLVKQTVERHPDCLPLLNEAYARHIREETRPTEVELMALLGRFTGLMVTFYVLDALDEAPVEIQLPILQKLASLNVKLFITSRPLKIVEAHFADDRVIHHFPIAANDEDLKLHIDDEISGSCDLQSMFDDEHAPLRQAVFTTIKQKSGGMFLHASLQLAALRECTSIHEIEQTLTGFPVEIEDLYIQTWQRILSQPSAKALLAQKVLMWVLNATRSLTVEELRHAIATCPDTHQIEKTRLVKEHMLIGVCGGLVAIEEETRHVRLVHYTAKDVLVRLVEEAFPHPHTLLAAVCMSHLTECGFQGSTISSKAELDETFLPNPFLRYAFDSWSAHCRESLSDPPAAARCEKFVQSCHSFPVFDPFIDTLGPLHVVAFFDLPIILAGPDNLQSPNSATTKRGETALHIACERESMAAVEELLRLPNLLVDARDNFYRTPFELCLIHHKENLVSLLLTHPDIDPNDGRLNGYAPLHWAIHASHQEMMKVLLSHPRINVNLGSNLGKSPLDMASRRGLKDVVQLLLAHPRIRVTNRNIEAARKSHGDPDVRDRIVALLQEFMGRKAAEVGDL